MTKVVLAVALAASLSWVGSAQAAEALLLKHEVIEVPVGGEAKLRPGFFIGAAHNLDGSIAEASMDRAHREVMIHGRNSGRTIVTAWNLREPNKRVELEIVVTDSGLEAGYAAETFYSATTPPAASDPAPVMTSANATDEANAATATDDDPANDEDAAAATTDAPSDETADPN